MQHDSDSSRLSGFLGKLHLQEGSGSSSQVGAWITTEAGETPSMIVNDALVELRENHHRRASLRDSSLTIARMLEGAEEDPQQQQHNPPGPRRASLLDMLINPTSSSAPVAPDVDIDTAAGDDNAAAAAAAGGARPAPPATPSHLLPPRLTDVRPYSHSKSLLFVNGLAFVVVLPAALLMVVQRLLLTVFESDKILGGTVLGFSLLARLNQELCAALLRWSLSYSRDRLVHLPVELLLTVLMSYYLCAFRPPLFVMTGISTFSYAVGLTVTELTRRDAWIKEFWEQNPHAKKEGGEDELPEDLKRVYAGLLKRRWRNIFVVFKGRVLAVFSYWTLFWIVNIVQVVPMLEIKKANLPAAVQVAYSGFFLPVIIWLGKSYLLSWFWKKVIVPDSRKDGKSAFELYRKWVAVICTGINFTSFTVLFQYSSTNTAVMSALLQLATELVAKLYTITQTLKNCRKILKGTRAIEGHVSTVMSATREVGVQQVLANVGKNKAGGGGGGTAQEDDETLKESPSVSVATRRVAEEEEELEEVMRSIKFALASR